MRVFVIPIVYVLHPQLVLLHHLDEQSLQVLIIGFFVKLQIFAILDEL